MELMTGIKGKEMVTVEPTQTAAVYGSGSLEVFATPAMIALMEKTALNSVQPYLGEGRGTVGTMLNVRHTAATPVGMTVTCETELIEIDRRRLVFNVRAYDACGLIGEGTHERFIIENERFMQKANAKSESVPVS